MTWVHKVRLRVFALIVGIVLAAIGGVSFASGPVWPVIGVAVAATALVVNRMTARLAEPVCWGCEENLTGRPAGDYGVVCPRCGAINEARRSRRA